MGKTNRQYYYGVFEKLIKNIKINEDNYNNYSLAEKTILSTLSNKAKINNDEVLLPQPSFILTQSTSKLKDKINEFSDKEKIIILTENPYTFRFIKDPSYDIIEYALLLKPSNIVFLNEEQIIEHLDLIKRYILFKVPRMLIDFKSLPNEIFDEDFVDSFISSLWVFYRDESTIYPFIEQSKKVLLKYSLNISYDADNKTLEDIQQKYLLSKIRTSDIYLLMYLVLLDDVPEDIQIHVYEEYRELLSMIHKPCDKLKMLIELEKLNV